MNKIKTFLMVMLGKKQKKEKKEKKPKEKYEKRTVTEPNFFVNGENGLTVEIKEIWKSLNYDRRYLLIVDSETGDEFIIEEPLFEKLFKRIPKKTILNQLGMKL